MEKRLHNKLCKHAIKHHHLPLEDRNGFAINDELAILVRDVTRVPAMGGVILEHVDLGSRSVMI